MICDTRGGSNNITLKGQSIKGLKKQFLEVKCHRGAIKVQKSVTYYLKGPLSVFKKLL